MSCCVCGEGKKYLLSCTNGKVATELALPAKIYFVFEIHALLDWKICKACINKVMSFSSLKEGMMERHGHSSLNLTGELFFELSMNCLFQHK